MILDTRIGNGVTGCAPVLEDSYRIICCSTTFWLLGGCSHLGVEARCSSGTKESETPLHAQVVTRSGVYYSAA